MTRRMTSLKIVAASTVLALGMGTIPAASAAPFTVDPTSLGVSGSSFVADFISGFSSTLLTQTSPNQYTADGWIQYTAFSYGGTYIPQSTSGLGSGYGLYATFQQTFSCPGGIDNGCSVDSIALNLLADVGNTNSYSTALPNAGGTPAVTDNGPTDVLLATADTVYQGVAGINALGGAYENVTTNLVLTSPDGTNYFILPTPFWGMALSAFNNTSNGVTCSTAGDCLNSTYVAIQNEIGGTSVVPEPSTVVLFGVGLLVMGASLRRRLS